MIRKEKIYDCTFFNSEYLDDNDSRKINLQYFMLCNEEKGSYGIEILKKEKNSLEIETIEINKVEDYCNNIQKVKDVIIKLGNNKVTPLVLNEILDEI